MNKEKYTSTTVSVISVLLLLLQCNSFCITNKFSYLEALKKDLIV